MVPTGQCVDRPVTGINVAGDHLLLTPAAADSNSQLTYNVEYETFNSALIVVCNPTPINRDDGTTHFNLMSFDAQ